MLAALVVMCFLFSALCFSRILFSALSMLSLIFLSSVFFGPRLFSFLFYGVDHHFPFTAADTVADVTANWVADNANTAK